MIHSYNRPAPSSHRPKAAFLIEPESFDAVFGPDEIAKLRPEWVHADEIPKWLAQSGLKDKLPGGVGKLF